MANKQQLRILLESYAWNTWREEAGDARVDLSEAGLNGADLCGANLCGANLRKADLRGVDLSGASFFDTILLGVVPAKAMTLQRSSPLPLTFLRGVGLPDALIDNLPSLLGQSPQFYSCFISYSNNDEAFTLRLHADLLDKGVRCWIAPEDMKIGAKIRDTIDEAIHLSARLLLVLSEASIASDWVEDEVDKAFEEERQRGGVVLFPVRLDVVADDVESGAVVSHGGATGAAEEVEE